MKTLTFDTNCLVAVADEKRAERGSVLSLLDASRSGKVEIAMVASSAAEKQLGGGYLSSISEFRARMNSLGFGHVKLLKPIATFGVSFFDYAIWATEEQVNLQTEIFKTLFPTTSPNWSEHAASLGQKPEDDQTPDALKWRNRLLDVQAIWTHLNEKRDVFVTSDKNFEKRFAGNEKLRSTKIMTPQEAADLI